MKMEIMTDENLSKNNALMEFKATTLSFVCLVRISGNRARMQQVREERKIFHGNKRQKLSFSILICHKAFHQ
jgi:hypothetical protein